MSTIPELEPQASSTEKIKPPLVITREQAMVIHQKLRWGRYIALGSYAGLILLLTLLNLLRDDGNLKILMVQLVVKGEEVLNIDKDFSGLIPIPLEIEGIVGITSVQELMVDTGITLLDVNVTTLNGFNIDTKNGLVDDGTQRIVLSNDYLSTANVIVNNPVSTPLVFRLRDESTYTDSNPIGNYSGGEDYHYIATADNTHISKLIIWIEDNTVFAPNGYASLGYALPNGITLWYDIGSGHVNLTPEPVKTNGDWGSNASSSVYYSYGMGNNALYTIFIFNEFVPGGIVLNNGDSIGITLNDDFTGIINHYFTIQGYILT
jgi:hypothetical protein